MRQRLQHFHIMCPPTQREKFCVRQNHGENNTENEPWACLQNAWLFCDRKKFIVEQRLKQRTPHSGRAHLKGIAHIFIELLELKLRVVPTSAWGEPDVSQIEYLLEIRTPGRNYPDECWLRISTLWYNLPLFLGNSKTCKGCSLAPCEGFFTTWKSCVPDNDLWLIAYGTDDRGDGNITLVYCFGNQFRSLPWNLMMFCGIIGICEERCPR